MNLSRRNLRPATWVAIFALLVQALLPGLLHASTKKSAEFVEICTAFGIKKVSLSQDAGDAPQRQHCPICQVADAVFLPGDVPAFIPAMPAAFELAAFPSTPDYASARLIPQLRGPPSRS